MDRCPINRSCPCSEYSKQCLCDFPYRNSDKEVMAIELWGHRLPDIKYPEKVGGRN
jgi:hypothetical protein